MEKGREACQGQVWILEMKNSELIVQEIRILEELEIQRDQKIGIVQSFGSPQSEAQAISLAIKIKELKAKIEELSAKGVKIAGIAPEQVIQKYVADLKQQISELRLTLDSDLASYRENYEKAVKAGRPNEFAKIQELRSERKRLLIKKDITDKLILEHLPASQSKLPK